MQVDSFPTIQTVEWMTASTNHRASLTANWAIAVCNGIVALAMASEDQKLDFSESSQV
jgi:hypothetical protein